MVCVIVRVRVVGVRVRVVGVKVVGGVVCFVCVEMVVCI